jgi:sigma-B regulation protein RsbU (phosphoserine phosphatase)
MDPSRMTDSPTPDGLAAATRPPAAGATSDRELLSTLFELGREVTSVLDVAELLPRIPELIARLTSFTVFSVYLLDDSKQELRIAYAVGYPEEAVRSFRLKVGEGIVGAAVKEQRPILVNDVRDDPRFLGVVAGVRSELVVPLRHKGEVLGALNLLSDRPGAFTDRDEQMLRQFGAHVAQALVNARLFASEREYGDTMETLAEIGREMSGILDLDELLTRVAHLVKRLIAYRTFGIALLDAAGATLEMKLAISYGESQQVQAVPLGEGLVGYAALHKEPVLVNDVSKDPRYINAVADARSELVVPLLVKDRCIGVVDLESPELDAFTKRHLELLTLLAAQAAGAIENARLYQALRENEERLDNEVKFAQRVQMALLPRELPKKLKGIDIAWDFAAAQELGGDLYDFLVPDAHHLVAAVGDVSGKGVPAALYSVFAGEVIRGRTFRRRYMPERSSPAAVLASVNRILHERELIDYYCTLCYAVFDMKHRTVTLANSGLPYPIRCVGDTCEAIDVTGVPLGSFGDIQYDEVKYPLHVGDVYVFCTDGISETFDEAGNELGRPAIIELVRQHRDLPAQDLVRTLFDHVNRFQGTARQHDDRTVVVVKITG